MEDGPSLTDRESGGDTGSAAGRVHTGATGRRDGRARRRPVRRTATCAISSADGSHPVRPVQLLWPMRAPRGMSAATFRKYARDAADHAAPLDRE